MSLTCKKWGGLPVGSICDEFSDFPYNNLKAIHNQDFELQHKCRVVYDVKDTIIGNVAKNSW